MAFSTGVLRRVQASKFQDDSEFETDSQSEGSLSGIDSKQQGDPQNGSDSESSIDEQANEDQFDTEDQDEDEAGNASSASDSDPKVVLAGISFGDLASAQASLNNSRKRKRTTFQGEQDDDSASSNSRSRSRSPSPFHEAEERLAGKSKANRTPIEGRSSKNAPVEQSSKKAVSRRRTVISAPKVEARDPRFSTLSGGGLDANKVAQNYAFLNEYRAGEMRQLKEQIRSKAAARDAALKERLTRQLRAMEDRERARKKVEDEKAVVREHRRREGQAVSKGKKPFFLKKAEVRKQVLVKRFEGLGEKKVEKVIEKRRKKKAMKERKAMPMNRREVG